MTASARRIGPTWVNALRIFLAVVLHGVTHWALTGSWIPQARNGQVVLLAASGVLGLSLGDLALFHAFLDMGPRSATLVMSAAPVLAALFGWLALNEALSLTGWVGIGLTAAGVAWVLTERTATVNVRTSGQAIARHRIRGTVLALVASVCQAGGLLLSKQGMGHGWLPIQDHLPPQSAALVRMAFACMGMVPILGISVLRSRGRPSIGRNVLSDTETKVDAMPVQRAEPRDTGRSGGIWFACCGAVTGPFLGVWTSLIASDRAPIGMAQTLMSLTPILLLPFAASVHKERIGLRAVLGAVVALVGLAILFVA